LDTVEGMEFEKETEEWVVLNVGGELLRTTRTTLIKEPDSMLAKMFQKKKLHKEKNLDTNLTEEVKIEISGKIISTSENNSSMESRFVDQVPFSDLTLTSSPYEWNTRRDENGAILIDQDPHYFKAVLNYLRYNQLILDKNISVDGVMECAAFFGIQSMVDLLIANAPQNRIEMFHVQIVDYRIEQQMEIHLIGATARSVGEELNTIFSSDKTTQGNLAFTPRKKVCALERCDFSAYEVHEYRCLSVIIVDAIVLAYLGSQNFKLVSTSKSVKKTSTGTPEIAEFDYWLQKEIK